MFHQVKCKLSILMNYGVKNINLKKKKLFYKRKKRAHKYTARLTAGTGNLMSWFCFCCTIYSTLKCLSYKFPKNKTIFFFQRF